MKIQEKAAQATTDQVVGKKDDIKSRKAADGRKKLEKACSDFESLFIYQILKTMRQTVPKGGSGGQMPGKDKYEMMLDQKVAEDIAAQRGGIGLQKLLVEKMGRYQAVTGENTKK